MEGTKCPNGRLREFGEEEIPLWFGKEGLETVGFPKKFFCENIDI